MSYLVNIFEIFIVLIGFGGLIFIHEMGHFLAAKWAGIRTESFAVGMGPVLFSWRKGVGFHLGSTRKTVINTTGQLPERLSDLELKKFQIGETEYSLRVLPLGGFVRMTGQDDTRPGFVSGAPRSYSSAPIYKRMIVVSAGVVANIILAAFFFMFCFLIGVRFESPVVGGVSPGGPAYESGIISGDEIVSIDGDPVHTFTDLQIAVAMAKPENSLEIEINRENETLKFEVLPELDSRTEMLSVGIVPATTLQLSSEDKIYDEVLPRFRLEGVPRGATLVSFDNRTFLTRYDEVLNWFKSQRLEDFETISYWKTLENEILQVPLFLEPSYPQRITEFSDISVTEPTLLGLTPLVQVAQIPIDSPNFNVLKEGDVVLSIGTVNAPGKIRFLEAVRQLPLGPVNMRVLRAGQEIELVCKVVAKSPLDFTPMLGILLDSAFDYPLVAESVNEFNVEQVLFEKPKGLERLIGGAKIISVNGVKISNWHNFWKELKNKNVSQSVLIASQPLPGNPQVKIDFEIKSEVLESLGQFSVQPLLTPVIFEPLWTTRKTTSPLEAIKMGIQETISLVHMTYLTIDRLIGGTMGVEHLHGPVGVVHLGSRLTSRGVAFMIFFLAIISVNLAVINFLPLPIVDGGLFIYLIYELIFKKPPPVFFQNIAGFAGLILIGTIFFITFYNDLVRLFSS